MFVYEILPDLGEAAGRCADDETMRRLEDAQELLTNAGLLNPMIGEVSICVCGGFFTLPYEAETPLAVNVNGSPTVLRNEWIEYHLNGPGELGWTPCGMSDALGVLFPTFRDPDRPVLLAVKIYSASDENKKFRVYGYKENGDKVFSVGSAGNMEDGFYVPTLFGRTVTPLGIDAVVHIEKIVKDEFNDMVDLYAVDPANPTVALSLLGRYRPKETVPQYTRIRTSVQQAVRVRFKRRNTKLSDQYDWINTDSREALIHAIRAVRYRNDGKYQLADYAEATALRLARQKTNAQHPKGIAPPQIIHNDVPVDAGGEQMFYS